MKHAPWANCALSCAFALATTAAFAADYYVATTGDDDNDGLSAATPFATIDAAITNATEASDVIHVAAGTYSTTTQWGPNLKTKLIGEGATRDDVVIQSAGTYRTLRMAGDSWLEKVTIVGEGTYKAGKSGPCTVTIGGKAYGVELKKDGKAVVNGKEYAFSVEDGIKAAPAAAPSGGAGTEVKASVPGSVLRVNVKQGDTVAEGDELLVMDVMKMEQPVMSPCGGTVQSVMVAQTDKVATGDVLVVIG